MNILFISLISLFTFSQPEPPKEGTTLSIDIQGLESNDGKVLILLFNDDGGFPENDQLAYKILELPINKQLVKVVEDVPEGIYAISVLHDADGNGKMKKNGVGFPTEAFGFSNDPSILFGIPSFKKCSFEVKADKKNYVTIKLK